MIEKIQGQYYTLKSVKAWDRKRQSPFGPLLLINLKSGVLKVLTYLPYFDKYVP